VDIPFVRFATSCFILYIFYFAFVSHPYDPSEPSGANQRAAERRQLLLRRSREMASRGQAGRALETVLRLKAQEPRETEILRLTAELYHQLGRYADEAAVWEDFMTNAPLPREACPYIGMAYRLVGRMDKSFESFQRCLALDEKDPDALLFVAMYHERRAELAEARRILDRALAISPTYPDLLIARARIAVRLGNWREARKLVEPVLQRQSDDPDALLVAAMASLAAGDLARARAYVDRGLASRPNDTDLLALRRSVGSPPRKTV
jgi:tetratricopeptide (TPR) repeat protein